MAAPSEVKTFRSRTHASWKICPLSARAGGRKKPRSFGMNRPCQESMRATRANFDLEQPTRHQNMRDRKKIFAFRRGLSKVPHTDWRAALPLVPVLLRRETRRNSQ